jgi:RecA/RadA recombinase
MVTFKKAAKTQNTETTVNEAENTNTTNSSTNTVEDLNTATKNKAGRKPSTGNVDLSSSPFLKQNTTSNNSDDDFTSELIKQVNKDVGMRIAFDLTKEDAPTSVKRWIPTGCEQLDYIIGNMRGGGLPEGRIVEICGKSGIGKSTLTQVIARNTQAMGGLVVYIDTENATSTQNLAKLGINLKRLVFVQEVCTEDIFKTIESTILKAKQLKKDIPVTVIWDSIAASAPKAELEAEYDQQSMGLQARALRKGLRKINQMLGNEKVLLILNNHITTKLGCISPETEINIRQSSSI